MLVLKLFQFVRNIRCGHGNSTYGQRRHKNDQNKIQQHLMASVAFNQRHGNSIFNRDIFSNKSSCTGET